MRNVAMLDLQAEYESLQGDVRAAIGRVLDHQRFIGGPEVGELEQRLADLCKRKFAVAVSRQVLTPCFRP